MSRPPEFRAIDPSDRIWVVGHQGLLGGALVKRMRSTGLGNIFVADDDGSLKSEQSVDAIIESEQPAAIIVAPTRDGGIQANREQSADLLIDNLQVGVSVIASAKRFKVPKLIYVATNHVYPQECPQPITEEDMFKGDLDPNYKPFAIANMACMELINSLNLQYGTHYYSVTPCNIYGPCDDFDPSRSRVIPALIAKFLAAKDQNDPQVTVWGSGQQKREFIFSEDCAEAIIHLATHLTGDIMSTVTDSGRLPYQFNIGSGEETTIAGLAETIAKAVGYDGQINFDKDKPEGAMRRVLDNSRLRQLGWSKQTDLRSGIKQTVSWAKQNVRL